MDTITANGTELYYEIRGDGPPLLLITGATGDAGVWSAAAGDLADSHTVITFDRRGNSRSPAPEGWTETSIEEQADDAAALLRVLDRAPAVVVGNSLGAVIAFTLVERHPDLVDCAVLHEPPLLGVVADGPQLGTDLQELIESGFRDGGPSCAMERFLRWAIGDQALDGTDTRLRERMLSNGDVFFGKELPSLNAWQPYPDRLKKAAVRVVPVAGVENLDNFFHEGTAWLARELDAELVRISGAHAPYLDRPTTFAKELRTMLADGD